MIKSHLFKTISIVTMSAVIVSGCGSLSAPALSDEVIEDEESIDEEETDDASDVDSKEDTTDESDSDTSTEEEEANDKGDVTEEDESSDDEELEDEDDSESDDEDDSDDSEEFFTELGEELIHDGEELKYLEIADYDGDGWDEAFGFIHESDDDVMDAEYGSVVYLAEDKIIQYDKMSCNEIKLVRFQDQYFYVASEAFVTSTVDHVYGLVDGSPRRILAGFGHMILEEDSDDFTAIFDAYDLCSDGTGHSWKPYYFTFHDGEFYEYGGIEITEDEFAELDGAQDIIDELTEDYEIDSIYYRANGIINVNLAQDDDDLTQYSYCTLIYDDGAVSYEGKDLEYSMDGGRYLDAATKLAVYPDELGGSIDFDNITTASSDTDEYVYQSRFGVEIRLPAKYKDMLVIESEDKEDMEEESFCLKDGGYAGDDAFIYSLCKVKKEYYEENKDNFCYDGMFVYEQVNGYIIFGGGPTDVCWRYEDEEINKNYQELRAALDTAIGEAFGR